MSSKTASLASGLQADIQSQSATAVPEGKAPVDLSKAQALTQAAIQGLGGPVFASMTDHKPVDGALAKALQDIAIQKQGIVAVPANKAKPDRAINEALTLKAIGAGKTDLKHTETKEAEVDLKALQADSDAEKARKIAANTFGGSDIKAGMPNIMKEIEGQGGIIAVPADRAPKDNVSLSHTKTLMEIDALKGEAIYASGTDNKIEDKALTQAKMLHAISHQGEKTVNAEKIAGVEAKATTQAHLIMALGSGDRRGSLKAVAAVEK